jgi:glycosyltransferase involved in cell wall biosynthesis
MLAVVPALDEEATVEAVIAEIRRAEPGMAIVVVDDGSTDRTVELARLAGVTVLELPYNLGIGGAVQTGFRYALEEGFDIVVQVDADGQHDPGELERLLPPLLEERADVVIGSRFADRGTDAQATGLRRLAMHAFGVVVSAAIGQRVRDTSSSFRALNRRAVAFCAAEYPHGFLETIEVTALLAHQGFRLVEVPVTMRPRGAGRSSLGVLRTLAYAAKVLLAVLVSRFRRTDPSWEPR